MKTFALSLIFFTCTAIASQVNNPNVPSVGCGVSNNGATNIGCGVQVASVVQPGSPGFLPVTGVTNNVTNLALQSQTFGTSPWAKANVTSAAPTLTANAGVAPDATNTATRMDIPAVSAVNARSFIYQPFTSVLAVPEPYTASIYVKGAVGGETIWIATGIPTFTRTKIVATTSWQRFTYTFVNQASPSNYLEIGVDLQDPGETAQPAQTVYIWGAQLTVGQYAGTYIPTTTTTQTQSQTTTLPAGIAFRDFSTLAGVNSGNPVISPAATGYSNFGVATPRIRSNANIGGTWYGLAACTQNNGWLNLCTWTSTNLTTWSDPGATINPATTFSTGTWKVHYLLHPSLSPSCSIDTYCAYYSAENTAPGSTPSIGLMHSSDLKHWTDYASNPVINDSTSTGQQLTSNMLPSVVQIGSTLYLYAATGCTSFCKNFIVYWTSPASDGINWTYGGVALSPAGSGDWDFGDGALDPSVFLNSHGFYEMAFTVNGTFAGNSKQQIGYAISKDGVNFYRYQTAPLLAPATTAFPANQAYIGDAILFENGGTFYVYSDAADLSVTGNWGYVATMVGH